MVDTEELVTSGEFNDDISMLVRHGLIDDVIANDDVVFSDEIEDDTRLEVNMLEENSKSKVKQVLLSVINSFDSFSRSHMQILTIFLLSKSTSLDEIHASLLARIEITASRSG